MAIDLIDLVKGYLTPDVIQKAAGNVGESTSATQKSLAGIVPTLVGALANTASTNDGAQQLTRMLDTGKYDGSILDNVGSLFGGGTSTQTAMNTGKGILDRLLGSKIGGVSDLLAPLCRCPFGLGIVAAGPRSAYRPACAWQAARGGRHQPGRPGRLARRAEELSDRPGAGGPRLLAGVVGIGIRDFGSRRERGWRSLERGRRGCARSLGFRGERGRRGVSRHARGGAGGSDPQSTELAHSPSHRRRSDRGRPGLAELADHNGARSGAEDQ
jgi:Bacterial protein of unknown function (DUF937)